MAALAELAIETPDGLNPNAGLPESIEPRNEKVVPQWIRGHETEEMAAKAINALDIVRKVIINPWASTEDINGHDLTIIFTEKSGLETVWVQAKSGARHLKEYRRKVRDRLIAKGIDMPVEEWMKMNRIILINGRKPDKVIRANFLGQLALINESDRQRQTFQRPPHRFGLT